MSADNGVYILKTKDQYRVAHLQGIDNVSWSIVDGNWQTKNETRNMCVPTRVVEMWGKCKYTSNIETALKVANRMLKELTVCEYGIKIITYNKTWNQIMNDAQKYARKEIEYINKNKKQDFWFYNLKNLQLIANGEFV